MKIQPLKISDLQLDPNNARKHSDKNLEAIAGSLKQFGQRTPIVLHRGVVIKGNGTVQAARLLGWTEIDVVEAPDEWDDATAKAYALADNRTAELAEWDESVLADTLLELKDLEWDTSAFGFEEIATPSGDDWSDAFDATAKEQSPFQQVTFTLSHEQVEVVDRAIAASIKLGEFPDVENTNKNGNALARMAELFIGSHER